VAKQAGYFLGHGYIYKWRSASVEEDHNNLTAWVGTTRCTTWPAWPESKLLCSLSLRNTEILGKWQGTKPLALETEAAGGFNAQRKSLKSPEHPVFMGWRSLSTVWRHHAIKLNGVESPCFEDSMNIKSFSQNIYLHILVPRNPPSPLYRLCSFWRNSIDDPHLKAKTN